MIGGGECPATEIRGYSIFNQLKTFTGYRKTTLRKIDVNLPSTQLYIKKKKNQTTRRLVLNKNYAAIL